MKTSQLAETTTNGTTNGHHPVLPPGVAPSAAARIDRLIDAQHATLRAMRESSSARCESAGGKHTLRALNDFQELAYEIHLIRPPSLMRAARDVVQALQTDPSGGCVDERARGLGLV